MIRVKPAEEPPTFENEVRGPGLRALAEMVGEPPPTPRTKGQGRPFKTIASRREDIPTERLPTYWTKALGDLMDRYGNVCAYACFRIHPVTGARSVDHMAPKSRTWDRVYEWSNYRLACSLLNARKRDFSDVLDPFEVRDDWFELELFGFQVRPRADLDERVWERVDRTIQRLGLNDDAFLQARERDVSNYWEGKVSLEVLREESPFVARELQRQDRLRPDDVRRQAPLR